jgi:hypothetical protein
MDPCHGEMVCPPPNIGWSALLLWTITVYGVLTILSLFVTAVHWREPTATGSRILRLLSIFDLAAAGIAPLLILVALGAPRAAAVAVAGQLGLVALCRGAARRRSRSTLPQARALR